MSKMTKDEVFERMEEWLGQIGPLMIEAGPVRYEFFNGQHG